ACVVVVGAGVWVWALPVACCTWVCVPAAELVVVVCCRTGADCVIGYVAVLFGRGLDVAAGWTVTVLCCCAAAGFDECAAVCCDASASGCTPVESVLVLVSDDTGVPSSDGEAVVDWPLEELSGSAAAVSAPPTIATAVAATARRLFFFHCS